MGKTKSQQPNAPDLQQVLWQQPPHNPYYPDLGASSQLLSPPPYSNSNIVRNAVPMTMVSPSANQTDYSRLPGHQPSTIIVSQPMPSVNYSRERHHEKIRKYNNEMIFIALLSILGSLYAYSLYQERPCFNFVVYQASRDVIIRLKDVKEMHLMLAAGGGFILLLAFMRSCIGKSHSYCLYKFLMGLSTLLLAIISAYLTYWTFYSPCSTKVNELFANGAKTFLSNFDVMPPPEKQYFHESNVLQLIDEDKRGFIIFVIAVINLILYFSAFLSTTMLC